MGEFLLDYWWIIGLVALLILVVTRNLIKFVITIVILFVAVNLLWEVLVTPGLDETSVCSKRASEKIRANTEEIKALKDTTERNNAICSFLFNVTTEEIRCLDESRSRNGLGFIVYKNIPAIRKQFSKEIEDYNKVCLDSPISRPDFW